MGVCACGGICRVGEGWCQKCFMFWSAWWLRYVNDDCGCAECKYRRETQPVVDLLEKENAARA